MGLDRALVRARVMQVAALLVIQLLCPRRRAWASLVGKRQIMIQQVEIIEGRECVRELRWFLIYVRRIFGKKRKIKLIK